MDVEENVKLDMERNVEEALSKLIAVKQISLTRVQHKVGSRDEMRWSPYIIGPWVARVPADHAWRTITKADEMEQNGWDECGEMVEWNLW